MTENVNATPVVEDEKTEGEKAYIAYAKKVKHDKRIRIAVGFTAMAGIALLAYKTIATPTPEDNETSEV